MSVAHYILGKDGIEFDEEFYEKVYTYILKKFNHHSAIYINYYKEFYNDIDVYNKDEFIKDLKVAITLLKPGRKRDVLIDRFKYNCSLADIAKKYNVNSGTISELLRHTISKLLVSIRCNRFCGDDLIAQSRLSTRTYNALSRAGYKTNKDLDGIDYHTFIHIRNAGIKSWNELCAYMDIYKIRYVPYIPKDEKEDEINISSIRKKLSKVLDTYYADNTLPSMDDIEIIDSHISAIEEILLKYSK